MIWLIFDGCRHYNLRLYEGFSVSVSCSNSGFERYSGSNHCCVAQTASRSRMDTLMLRSSHSHLGTVPSCIKVSNFSRRLMVGTGFAFANRTLRNCNLPLSPVETCPRTCACIVRDAYSQHNRVRQNDRSKAQCVSTDGGEQDDGIFRMRK